MRHVLLVLVLAATSGVWWFVVTRKPEALPAQSTSGTLNVQTDPTPSPATTPVMALNPASRAKLSEFTTKLEATRACYEREDCNYPRTDPRAYGFAVGQDLKKQIYAITAWVKQEQLADDSIAKLARDQLDNEDGHVQEAALALLATQPIGNENLEAILAKVIGGYDAQLVQQALKELTRYTDESDRMKITNALAEAMLTGSPFVAKTVSAGIQPFVYARSISIFNETAAKLPTGSVVKSNLEQALASFK